MDFGSVDGADDTFRVLRVSAENAESELSRGLIIAAGHAEEVQLEFNVYAAGQLVFIEILVGDLSGWPSTRKIPTLTQAQVCQMRIFVTANLWLMRARLKMMNCAIIRQIFSRHTLDTG